MELDQQVANIRKLEIELLLAAINISRSNKGIAAKVLDTSFSTVEIYSRLDSDDVTSKINAIMMYNRKSIFTIAKPFRKPIKEVSLSSNSYPECALKIRSLVRKIVVSIRDMATSHQDGTDAVMVVFGLTYEQALIIKNSTIDELEEWVYQNPCVLDLKFKSPEELVKLLQIKIIREAGMYLDRLAS